MFAFDLTKPGIATATLLDGRTLGIEVTDAMAVARCGLGVIDPQHGQGAGADELAAIEACLEVPLPPAGARLVTIRPDLDSVGAMAVLALRADGIAIDGVMRDRIRRIAAVDRFERGSWPGRRPLPESAEEILEDGIGVELSALAAAVADRAVPLAERVRTAQRWLVDGSVPEAYLLAATSRARALFRSLCLGATRVERWLGKRIGVVISLEPGALALAYRVAPVVVALNPAFCFRDGVLGAKYTLARWQVGYADLQLATDFLNRVEPGWGGQAGIKGSPLDRPSRLPLDMVVEAANLGLPRLQWGNVP